jgi:hypothetical protein
MNDLETSSLDNRKITIANTRNIIAATLGILPGQSEAFDQNYGILLRSHEDENESTLSWDVTWDENAKLGFCFDVDGLLLPPFSNSPWHLCIPSLQLREPNALIMKSSREIFEDVILPYRDSIQKHHFLAEDIEDWDDELARFEINNKPFCI